MASGRQAASRGVKLLLVIGILAAVIAGTYLVVSFRRPVPKPTDPYAVEEPIPTVLRTDQGLEIQFPTEARCENGEVNRFVCRLLKIIMAQDYQEYRLAVTQKREPVGPGLFEQAYQKLKLTSVKSIRPVEDRQNLKPEWLRDIPGPMYKLEAEAVMRDNSKREVQLYIFQEDGRWVSSH